MISRLVYYLRSIPTLLGQIRNWYILPLLPFRRRTVLHLRRGPSLVARGLMDAWIIKETCLDRDYERHGVPLQDGWTIIDIGAGLGDFALFAARRNPTGEIIACEPFPESYTLLQENVRRNGVGNVRPLPLAIGAASGELALVTTGAAVQHTTSTSGRAVESITVAALSLDDLFAREQILHCDFLKMDCEGGEFEILFHAGENTLTRIRRLCLEYHNDATPYTAADLARFLENNGFRVRTAANPVHKYLGFLYAERL